MALLTVNKRFNGGWQARRGRLEAEREEEKSKCESSAGGSIRWVQQSLCGARPASQHSEAQLELPLSSIAVEVEDLVPLSEREDVGQHAGRTRTHTHFTVFILRNL